MKMTVTVSPELQETIAELRTTNTRIVPLLAAAVEESALNVVNEAKRMCPRATGALQDSIEAEFEEGGLVATIGSWLPYAPKWEYSEVEHPVIGKGEWYFSTTSGKRYKSSSRIKMNSNPDATWGFFRKALSGEEQPFVGRIEQIAEAFLQ